MQRTTIARWFSRYWTRSSRDGISSKIGVTIERWWVEIGASIYSQAHKLLITADSGGSNGSRSRLWKVGGRDLANRLGLVIQVCHLPPGTYDEGVYERRLNYERKPQSPLQADDTEWAHELLRADGLRG